MGKFRIPLATLLAGIALVGAACSDDSEESDGGSAGSEETTTTAADGESTTTSTTEPDKTAVALAADTPNLGTFTELVQLAGMEETLEGTGPYTVLAPTDEAFDELPAGALDSLKADPNGALRKVIELQVLPEEMSAEDLDERSGECVDTLDGAGLMVDVSSGSLMVGGATVTAADMAASNGLVHITDNVITEPSADC